MTNNELENEIDKTINGLTNETKWRMELLRKSAKLIAAKITTPREYFEYALFWCDFELDERDSQITFNEMKNYKPIDYVNEYISDTYDWDKEQLQTSYKQLLDYKSTYKF